MIFEFGKTDTYSSAAASASVSNQRQGRIRSLRVIRWSSSWFAPSDCSQSVNGTVEREDLADASSFGLRSKVGLGKVEAVEFVYLQQADQSGFVDGLFEIGGEAICDSKRMLERLALGRQIA